MSAMNTNDNTGNNQGPAMGNAGGQGANTQAKAGKKGKKQVKEKSQSQSQSWIPSIPCPSCGREVAEYAYRKLADEQRLYIAGLQARVHELRDINAGLEETYHMSRHSVLDNMKQAFALMILGWVFRTFMTWKGWF